MQQQQQQDGVRRPWGMLEPRNLCPRIFPDFVFELYDSVYRIGSDRENDLMLVEDTRVCRYHGFIFLHRDDSGTTMWYYDHSISGTLVNSYRVHSRWYNLLYGDYIHIGWTAGEDSSKYTTLRIFGPYPLPQHPRAVRLRQPNIDIQMSPPLFALYMKELENENRK
ncbi:hypothetical protein BOX15_Mlig027303g3 [Macrostomum lignano]|uniref:FHA domain-containing protein n=1 Tax=Macrostomum lignano TaxID=282301 RepID=A0A267FHR5_9PLAT|nr:hypothetical protein BOX15_Mlig027303g1 [Macrostomum lignano]PAA79814.1 hypothetical protein BOX15_Mlig027303g3 [Macrostomum lignano]